jgi:hypothetical protein
MFTLTGYLRMKYLYCEISLKAFVNNDEVTYYEILPAISERKIDKEIQAGHETNHGYYVTFCLT